MKQAILVVTVQFLIEACKEARGMRGLTVTKHALPEDAQFVRAGYDETGALHIVLTSESFADVPPGDRLPVLPAPEFTATSMEAGPHG